MIINFTKLMKLILPELGDDGLVNNLILTDEQTFNFTFPNIVDHYSYKIYRLRLGRQHLLRLLLTVQAMANRSAT